MNNSIQRNLIEARADLRARQEDVARWRRIGCLNSSDRDLYAWSVDCFYCALDRLWEAQCMAGGSL